MPRVKNLKNLISPKAQSKEKAGLYYELHPNGSLKKYAFFDKMGEEVLSLDIKKDASYATVSGRSFASTWQEGKGSQLLTAFNDGGDEVFDNAPKDLYDWAEPNISQINKIAQG